MWDILIRQLHSPHMKLLSSELYVDNKTGTSGSVSSLGTMELSYRLDQLTLATMAMWELIRDQTSLTEKDLLSKMEEIDLRDGKETGKLAHGVKTCKSCNRPINPNHKKCLYCGAKSEKDFAFEGAL